MGRWGLLSRLGEVHWRLCSLSRITFFDMESERGRCFANTKTYSRFGWNLETSYAGLETIKIYGNETVEQDICSREFDSSYILGLVQVKVEDGNSIKLVSVLKNGSIAVVWYLRDRWTEQDLCFSIPKWNQGDARRKFAFCWSGHQFCQVSLVYDEVKGHVIYIKVNGVESWKKQIVDIKHEQKQSKYIC